jgi:CRISPR-associated protein Csm3
MTVEYMKTRSIQMELEVVTGLHVGAGKDSVEIGGIDNPVVKHPHTGEPYLPGSSVKGKLRSLLEWALRKVQDDGKPWGSVGRIPAADLPGDEILRIFGTTQKEWEAGPTRLAVRDGLLIESWVKSVRERGLNLTEEKSEVVINRIQGKAADTGPRRMERVPAGARFHLELQFRQFAVNGDGGRKDLECLNRVFEALKLMEKDALGGSGSRGYGQVRVRELSLDGQPVQEAFDRLGPIQLEAAQVLVES